MHTRSLSLSLSLLLSAVLASCSSPPSSAEQDEAALRTDRPPAYRDVEETFTSEADQNRWFDLRRGLAQDFDDICGDTFCEGDFSNLVPLGLRCSVSVRTGQLKSCLWLFAGSYESVTASTGNIRPVAKFFHCTFAPPATPAALMDALLAPGGRGPLWQPLPGGTETLYDVLGRCL
jgi:hypothetical protein